VRVWEAAVRRDAVLSAHPELQELEKNVAAAIKCFATGRSDDRAVRAAVGARRAYLERHGIPLDYAEPHWACAACHDEGYVNGEPCVCRQQAELDRIIAGSNLPVKLRQQTFDKFELKWYSTTKKTPRGVTERTCARDALRSCQAFVHACSRAARNVVCLSQVELVWARLFCLAQYATASQRHAYPLFTLCLVT